MQGTVHGLLVATIGLAAAGIAPQATADEGQWKDFGKLVERAIKGRAQHLFAIRRPLEESAQQTVGSYRSLSQVPGD